MKNIYTSIVTILLIFITFTGCSKEPVEPYYDRANQAADKAHDRLSKD